MIYKPDFKTAYILANEILVSSHKLNEFPFKTKEVINEISNIKCCSYSCGQHFIIYNKIKTADFLEH
jgi:hypothetical protein